MKLVRDEGLVGGEFVDLFNFVLLLLIFKNILLYDFCIKNFILEFLNLILRKSC